MKLVVDCECIVMQRALELFLEEFIVPYESADFIVSDKEERREKRVFLVGQESSFLKLPFDKKRLIDALEEFNFAILHRKIIPEQSLESRIEALFEEFKVRVLKEIKNG